MNKKKIAKKIEDLQSKSYGEVLGFIKSKDNYQHSDFKKYCLNIFWNSELPTKWIKELSSEYVFEDMLFDYFSKSDNVNQAFLDCAISYAPDLLIKIIKLSKSFDNQSHWESFTCFQKREAKFKTFYKELNFIKKIINEWNEKAKYYFAIAEQYDYEDILMHTVSYYEKFKRSSQKGRNNRNHIISIEMNINYVLNEILNIKHRKNLFDKKEITQKYSTDDFILEVKNILPPLNPIDGIIKGIYIPTEKITETKKILRETIEFFFSFQSFKYTVDEYLTGLLDFEYIEDFEALLITNEHHSLYQRNDNKSTYEEMLFVNEASGKSVFLAQSNKEKDTFDKEVLQNINGAYTYFNYLKLPLLYETQKYGTLDFRKVFRLLKSFSLFLMPSGRQIIGNSENGQPNVFIRPKPQDFLEYFTPDYIVSFDEKELLYNCEMYFDWDVEEIQNIIAYLTTDLCLQKKSKIDLLSRPLIKIGSQYVWLSSLLRDRRWEVIMHRRIVFEHLNNHIIQSAQIETELADEFIRAGFGAISSHCFEGGEIDTLAYKDKTLFVVELKTTYLQENLIRSAKYASQKFSYKASEQLERNVEYVNQYFDKLKATEELKIDCKKEEIKIIPLIVSNTSDADDYYFRNKFLKISMFELMVVLKNDLYKMLNFSAGNLLTENNLNLPIPSLLKMQNQSASNFKEAQIKTDKENCNLWSNKYECSADDLLTAINENKVWKFLDELKEFNCPKSVVLKQYDKEKKFVI